MSMIRINRRLAAAILSAAFFFGIFLIPVYAADHETDPSSESNEDHTDSHFTVEISMETEPENGKGFLLLENGILQESIQFTINITNDGSTDLTDFQIRTKPSGFASYADGRTILKPGESRKYKGEGDDGFIIDSAKLSDAEYLNIRIIISCKTANTAGSSQSLKKTKTLQIPVTVLKRGEKRASESPETVAESSGFSVIEDEGAIEESVSESDSERDATAQHGLSRRRIVMMIILSAAGILLAAGIIFRKRNR